MSESKDDGCGCFILIVIIVWLMAAAFTLSNRVKDLENRVHTLEDAHNAR